MNRKSERMYYVEKWAEFVKKNPDKIWSQMQAELLDAQFQNAQQIKLTKAQVRYIKRF